LHICCARELTQQQLPRFLPSPLPLIFASKGSSSSSSSGSGKQDGALEDFYDPKNKMKRFVN
jgi:hypothetical protein